MANGQRRAPKGDGFLSKSSAPNKKTSPKAVSIASAREIVDGSENLVGVGKQEPKPESGHGKQGG